MGKLVPVICCFIKEEVRVPGTKADPARPCVLRLQPPATHISVILSWMNLLWSDIIIADNSPPEHPGSGQAANNCRYPTGIRFYETGRMTDMPHIVSDYKDRLFNFLFGNEKNKEWTLSLYNAVNGTSYNDPSKIEINTIKEVLYLGMHNDVSFLITPEAVLFPDGDDFPKDAVTAEGTPVMKDPEDAGEFNLYEQQSSYNPNMPLRLLQYLGSLYEKYIAARKLNKYGAGLIRLPVPKLVVFYNGEAEMPDEHILRLSDAFPKGSSPDVEVRVRMININHGRNRKILDACRPLSEYSLLIDLIRKNYKSACTLKYGTKAAPRDIATREEKEAILMDAVDRAVAAFPKDAVILPFLKEHRAEVKEMLLTEYNEAEAMRLFFLDGERVGEKRGIEKGRNHTIYEMVQDGDISVARAAQKLKISEKQVRDNMLLLGFRMPKE